MKSIRRTLALRSRLSAKHLVPLQTTSMRIISKPIQSQYRTYHHSYTPQSRDINKQSSEPIERESMECDALIVGGGPAGLACAIRLKQLNPDSEVILIDKGSFIGAHTLSGACVETKSLDELLPDWKENGAPLRVPAKKDTMKYLTETSQYPLPIIPQMQNHGNYIISLGELCAWLAEQAEALGVQVFPGFSAREVIFSEDGKSVQGIVTTDMGRGKDGKPKDSFEPGMELRARQTIFAEGCRGSLTKVLFDKLDLRRESDHPTYALGVKEVWEIPDSNPHFEEGHVIHTVGWPLSTDTYGGSFMYHWDNNRINLGFVVSLDYSNPTLSPYQELQRLKTHPFMHKYLEGGKCIQYGARALNEGGIMSLPKLSFPGGILVGDCAGFLNVPKIKGVHTNMKSGMLGAESVVEALKSDQTEAKTYTERFQSSWLYEELYKERNMRNYFQYGFYPGMLLAGIDSLILRGRAPWTVGVPEPDHEHTKPLSEVKPIDYPKADGKLTFDLLTNLARSNTNHEDDQPCHLTLRDSSKPLDVNLKEYGERSMNFCPAGVYEFVDNDDGGKKFQINAQNCVHCKACDIKDMTQNIDWVTPQGGEGPSYGTM